MQNIVDINLENFQQIILQESQQKFILIDFWANNCEPCDELSPILSRISAEYPNEMILARVNCDEQPQIASQFGIRSLPTVMLVKDGQPVDGFAGPQPEPQIREMLEKHLPKAEDGLFDQAVQLVNQGDYQQAFPLIKQAYELNEQRADIKLVYADCSVETGNVELAKQLTATITMVDQDSYFQAIQGKIELAEQAAESPEITALQQALANDPDNMQLKVDLAIQLHQAHQNEEALSLLFSVLKQDLNFADARKVTLDMINALVDGDPLKSQYRRKIYSLLY